MLAPLDAQIRLASGFQDHGVRRKRLDPTLTPKAGACPGFDL